MLLPEPDEIERVMMEVTLDREPTIESGRTYWRIRRYARHHPEEKRFGPQVFAVDVELARPTGQGAVIASHQLKCRQAEKDASLGIEHPEHDEGCQFVYNGMGPIRAWAYMDVKDAILAALRWDADEDAEPFGWTRALDGTNRIRPKGDPLLEMIGGEAVVQ